MRPPCPRARRPAWQGPGFDDRMASQSSRDTIPETKPMAVPGVLEYEVEDDLVLYRPSTDDVEVLNGTAAAVWWLCDGTRTGQEIVEAIAHLYGQSVEQVRIEIFSIVERMFEEGLVTLA